MPLRHPKESGARHRRSMRILVASAAVGLLVAPGLARAGSATGGDGNDDAEMIADARRALHAAVIAYDNKKWDEMRALYTEDAVALVPNHDPIRGRDAFIEYARSVRDVYGPFDEGSFEPVRATANGKLADLVDKFTTESGRVRWLADEFFERQPDGSVLIGVDQVGFADAAG